jgi:hypothetical protein
VLPTKDTPKALSAFLDRFLVRVNQEPDEIGGPLADAIGADAGGLPLGLAEIVESAVPVAPPSCCAVMPSCDR